MALVTFYDIAGNELYKYPLLVTEASWIENRPGRLTFSVPTGLELFNYKYLKWGTKVTAQIDGFRYLWTGFIEPPRRWPQGSIVVNCKSMEYMFHYRRQRSVGTDGYLSAPLELHGTAGSLIAQILAIANSKRTTGIALGYIDMTGPPRQETVNETLDVHLRGISLRTDHIWNVTATAVGSRLDCRLNYFPRANTIVQYQIEEGVNLETPNVADILVEDGDVVNDVLGTGDFGIEEQVLAYNAEDPIAMNEFGLRQSIESFSGNVESDTIQRNTEEFLNMHKDAIKSLNPVLPLTPEIASQIQLNTLLPVRIRSAGFKKDGTIGFDGYAPVRSVTIDEFNQTISLIIGVDEL